MDYVLPNGNNPVRKWYTKELSADEQADIDVLLGTLENAKTWKQPVYKSLSGNAQGLGEIRWRGSNGRPLRLIGFHSPVGNKFTILIGCTHDGKKYQPPEAMSSAISRKRDLERNRGSICEHDFEKTD